MTVNGPAANTTVASLQIGSADGSSASSLNLQPGMALTVSTATTVNPNAALSVPSGGTLTSASLAAAGGTTAFAHGAVVNVGSLNVNGGMLQAADGGQFGSSGVTLGSGTLQLTGAGTFNNSQAVTVNGGVIDVPGSATLAGPIGGSVPLTKTGAGTLIVTATNNSFPSAAVNAGTLQGTTDSIQTNVVLNAAGANLTFNQSGSGSYGKLISGQGGLTKAGAGC